MHHCTTSRILAAGAKEKTLAPPEHLAKLIWSSHAKLNRGDNQLLRNLLVAMPSSLLKWQCHLCYWRGHCHLVISFKRTRCQGGSGRCSQRGSADAEVEQELEYKLEAEKRDQEAKEAMGTRARAVQYAPT